MFRNNTYILLGTKLIKYYFNVMFLCLLSIKGMVEPYISHSKFNVHVNNLLNRLDSIDKELLISYFIDKNKKTSLL